MKNILLEIISAITGLPNVTGSAVLIWLAVAVLTFVLSSAKFSAFVARYPRAQAFVGLLEGLGLDPRKVAEKARDVLKSKLPPAK